MYFRTVRGETRIPSFTSNSLAIRSSPQSGFSVAIRRMSRCSSDGIRGRPALLFQRQRFASPVGASELRLTAGRLRPCHAYSTALTERKDSRVQRDPIAEA